MLEEYIALMKQTQEAETLKTVQEGYHGLLRNHPNAAGQFYGRSHGLLYVRISTINLDFRIVFSIWSIDDGDIVLLGPPESEKKAEARLDKCLEEITKFDGWIPTKEQVEETARNTGCYWNQ